jgi:hypothetical protein
MFDAQETDFHAEYCREIEELKQANAALLDRLAAAANSARRVIQIAVAWGGVQSPDTLYALCLDGSLWELYLNGEQTWVEIETPNAPAATTAG